MLQFLSDAELESRVTSITMRYQEAESINDAIESIEQLFNATPATCRKDLDLLAEALILLETIKEKIEKEEGYEMLYNLYRREEPQEWQN